MAVALPYVCPAVTSPTCDGAWHRWGCSRVRRGARASWLRHWCGAVLSWRGATWECAVGACEDGLPAKEGQLDHGEADGANQQGGNGEHGSSTGKLGPALLSQHRQEPRKTARDARRASGLCQARPENPPFPISLIPQILLSWVCPSPSGPFAATRSLFSLTCSLPLVLAPQLESALSYEGSGCRLTPRPTLTLSLVRARALAATGFASCCTLCFFAACHVMMLRKHNPCCFAAILQQVHGYGVNQ